jgi:hypothetical protein
VTTKAFDEGTEGAFVALCEAKAFVVDGVGVAVAGIFFFTYAWAFEGVGGHHMKTPSHGGTRA